MKRKFGDRKDGRLMRELDSLHYVTGILYPNRCDNEAFISETIDLTNINAYLKKKNNKNAKLIKEGKAPDYKYNLFQLIVTALLRTIHVRPKMNRFIVNGNFYERYEVSTSFVVKKIYADNAPEALAFIHSKDDDTLDSIHNKIYEQVSSRRGDDDAEDTSTESMDIMNVLPRHVSKLFIHLMMLLDKHGLVPKFLIATDPYYSTAVISNLGSIKLKSGYHHLTNWGTCSMIMLIGEIKDRPFFNEDGSYEMRPSVDIGLTIDERIADGYYYSKTIRILKKLLENPKLLEETMNTNVEL